MKFQVGDIVTYHGRDHFYIGKEAKITTIAIRMPNAYGIKFYDNQEKTVWEEDLEYTKEKEKEPVGKVKWYHKGKLENKLYESHDFQIGDIVIYMGNQYRDRKGKECEIILARKSGTGFIIKFPDGFEHNCPKDLLGPADVKGKIRWYHKGKLELDENKLYESHDFQIGDIVTYHGVQLKDRIGTECEIISDEGGGDYKIKFLTDNYIHDCSKRYLKISDEPKIKAKWFYKGKLDESLEAGHFEVGDRVRHKERPRFMEGIVKKIDGGKDKNIVHIEFENNTQPGICEENCCLNGHCWTTKNQNMHLYEFLEDENKGKVRWYYKGKLESVENNFFEEGDYVKYIGWNPDYSGLNGTIERIDLNNHALIHFDDGRHCWWPFNQLSFKTEQVFSEMDPYGEERWEANESLKKNKFENGHKGKLQERKKLNEEWGDLDFSKPFSLKDKVIVNGEAKIREIKPAVLWRNVIINSVGQITQIEHRPGLYLYTVKLITGKHVQAKEEVMRKISDQSYDNAIKEMEIKKEFDPYDEEDWNLKEKLNEKLKFDDLYVGMRVKSVGDYKTDGKVGRIVEFDDGGVSVEFDDYINGHDCAGKAIDGHGWYFDIDDLEEIKEEPTGKIKWYHKGKLESKLYESQELFQKGDRVIYNFPGELKAKIGDICEILYVISLHYNPELTKYKVRLEKNGLEFAIFGKSLLPYNPIEKDNIKWYRKGKLVKDFYHYIKESSDEPVVIYIYDILMKHDDYNSFLDEVEELFLNERIAIYGLDDDNQYRHNATVNVIDIGNVGYIFEMPDFRYKSYAEYKIWLKESKDNDSQLFIVKTDKIIKKGNQKMNDIEIVNAYDKIVINPKSNFDLDPYDEDAWDDIN